MPIPESTKLDHSQSDLFSARARLITAFDTAPYNAALIEEIARLSFDLQEPVEAGRWYFCCDSQDEQAASLIDLFLRTFSVYPQQVFEQIPARILEFPPTSLPDAVRNRLSDACQSAVANEMPAEVNTAAHPTAIAPPQRPRKSVLDWLFRAFLLIVGGLILAYFLYAALIIGIIYVISWLFGR